MFRVHKLYPENKLWEKSFIIHETLYSAIIELQNLKPEKEVNYFIYDSITEKQTKYAKCVLCGEVSEFDKNMLTIHHLIPACYRKHMPKKYHHVQKNEMVFLCKSCHNRYEEQADVTKKELFKRLGIKNSPEFRTKTKMYFEKRYCANVLYTPQGKRGDKKELEKLRIHFEHISGLTACEESYKKVIEEKPLKLRSKAEQVVEKVVAEDKCEDFMKFWIDHFWNLQDKYMNSVLDVRWKK
jgi:5-methylcytosine-specific restriction endonuclease McrA